MAPVIDRNYFPCLGECLTGQQLLISWSLAATCLSDESGQRQNCQAVIDFFKDEYVHELLRDPLKAFAKPDETSRRTFETKTAPINKTSASNDHYNINDVKEDAQWLSTNADIDLVTALRLVVVEFQSRPASYLSGPLSSQDIGNLLEAAGLQNDQDGRVASSLPAKPASNDEIWVDFEKPHCRRRRLFYTLLSERRFFMITANWIYSMRFFGRLPFLVSDAQQLDQLYGFQEQSLHDKASKVLAAYLNAFADLVVDLENYPEKLEKDALLTDEDVELSMLRTTLTEAFHSLSIIFQTADVLQDFAPSAVLTQWFSLMNRVNFFNSIQAIDVRIGDLAGQLQCFSAVVSLTLLQPVRSLNYLRDRDDDAGGVDTSHDIYLLSPDVLEQIHECVVAAAVSECTGASPVIFAWSVLLHQMNVSYQSRTEKRDNLLQQNARETFETGVVARPSATRRNSAGSIFSIESSKFDGFLENTSLAKDTQMVEQLASAATARGTVYDVISRMATLLGEDLAACVPPMLGHRSRLAFLELLKITYPFVGYLSEPVSALLVSVSAGQSYWSGSGPAIMHRVQDPGTFLLEDDQLLGFYLLPALERFPFERTPLIAFCQALLNVDTQDQDRRDWVLQNLSNSSTLTIALPQEFQGYELVQEDENTNSFCLLQTLPLMSRSAPQKKRKSRDIFEIPAGTIGRFVTDTGRLVTFDYPHSRLAFLGAQLEATISRDGHSSELDLLEPSEIADTISILASVIRSFHTRADGSTTAALTSRQNDVILDISKYISIDKDIITIICEIMDFNMQEEQIDAADASVGILNACTHFLDAVLVVQPARVWSYLCRSEFLNSDSGAGKLSRLCGAFDLVSERFDLIYSSIRLFASLVDSAISSAIRRRLDSRQNSRSQPTPDLWVRASDKTLANVCTAVGYTIVDIYENTSTWRFDTTQQRVALLHQLIPLMCGIISGTHSCVGLREENGLTSCLRTASSYMLGYFLSSASGTLRFQPMLESLIIVVGAPDQTLCWQIQIQLRQHVEAILQFLTIILRAAAISGRDSQILRDYLFQISTLVARLVSTSENFREPVVRLFQTLIESAAAPDAEPPSLLAFLGPHVAKMLLQFLSRLEQPNSLKSEVITTWEFFASVLKHRQQWLSNCLLTGYTPREAHERGQKGVDKEKGRPQADSILAIAMTNLSNVERLDTEVALAILEFVTNAQNHWPWVVFTLQRDAGELESLLDYTRNLKPLPSSAKVNTTKASQEAKIGAYVAEIIAMQLYHSRHLANVTGLSSSLLSNLDYYLRDGVQLASYNKSLHMNFARNFASKYAGCAVDAFKRTFLEPRRLGVNYFYDVRFAGEMLQSDPGWLGRKNDGFKAEMERANANLSLVDAHIGLFHAWSTLLVELSLSFPRNEVIAKQMLQVAKQCLSANQLTLGPKGLALKLERERLNLTSTLIQKLAESVLPVSNIDQLIVALIESIDAIEEPYLEEIIGSNRVLVRILYITLRWRQRSSIAFGAKGESTMESQAVQMTQTVLSVIDRTVGRGFRALVGLIHAQDTSIVPSDLSVLCAITQACFNFPGIAQCQTQVLNILAGHDVVHAATSLFSWSDTFACHGDPVYGEISVLFLLELSSLPRIAEQLACDGIISSLLSAKLAKYLMTTKISPFGDAPIIARCYAIWAKGLIPLMLNLLTALGPVVAPEMAYVLNQCAHLVRAATQRFESPTSSRINTTTTQHYITPLSVYEITSLALIMRALSVFRVNNTRDIPTVEWDGSVLLENVQFWLSSKTLLKRRLVPLGKHEFEWHEETAASEGGFDNKLEEIVVHGLEAVRDVLSDELDFGG